MMQLSKENRLARRRDASAYQRAQANLALDFIYSFQSQQHPRVTTTEPTSLHFDLWGMGHDDHFIPWWSPGAMLAALLLLTLPLTLLRGRARDRQ